MNVEDTMASLGGSAADRDRKWPHSLSVFALVAAASVLALGAFGIRNWIAPPQPEVVPLATGSRAIPVDSSSLTGLARRFGLPVYWLGPQKDSSTRAELGSRGVTISYFPPGSEAESLQPMTAVGTYTQENPAAVLRALATENHKAAFTLPDGSLALATTAQSVFVAPQGAGVLVEVFNTHPNEARDAVLHGGLVAVAP